jgi:hypothetical protein
MELEGGYRCTRKLREVPPCRLLVEIEGFARMDGESLRLRLLEAIQDRRWISTDTRPCEMKCLSISTEWRKVGKVREDKLGASDLHGLAEMYARTTNPCPGHQG